MLYQISQLFLSCAFLKALARLLNSLDSDMSLFSEKRSLNMLHDYIENKNIQCNKHIRDDALKVTG